MTSENYVIVKADTLYNNEKDGFVINDSVENVGRINREVEVISSPSYARLKKGDLLIIHHNILRKKYDVRGNIITSNFHIEDDLYYVPLTEIFMFDSGDGWKAFNPFVFIKPISVTQKIVGFDIKEDVYKNRLNHVGILTYSNEWLEKQGFKEGDKVAFAKYSEYEFEIEGEIYYKMTNKEVLFKIND